MIPNALNKIWFSHSGWCFHGVALKQSDLLQSYLSKWLKDSQRVSSKSDGMLREFWEQFPDICLNFYQKKKKKKKKKKTENVWKIPWYVSGYPKLSLIKMWNSEFKMMSMIIRE